MDQLIIHNLIVHELNKQPEERDTRLVLSQSHLPVTDNSLTLVARLEEIFEKKADVLQGYLASPDESLVPGLYAEWLEAGRNHASFIHASREMVRALSLALTGVIGAKGGYLLFADYTVDERRILGVFMIRDKSGLTFVNEGGQMDLSIVQHLDVDNLAMAARIIDGPGRNVQLLRHNNNQRKISQYFMDWIGIRDSSSSTELTWEFMEMVSELPLPKDKETGFAMEEADFDRALIQYAAKSPQQTIAPADFDRHFYGNETPLQDMITDTTNGALTDGFRVDRRVLRQQFHLKATSAGLTVHCNREHLSAGLVSIDEQAGTILIHSSELASILLDQNVRG